MPSYKVIKPGFFDGRLYDPNGKRRVLHTDKQFPVTGRKKVEQVPNWLQRVDDESTEDRRGRESKEREALRETAESKTDTETFLAAESEQSSNVEIL